MIGDGMKSGERSPFSTDDCLACFLFLFLFRFGSSPGLCFSQSFIFCVLAFWVYDRYDVIVFSSLSLFHMNPGCRGSGLGLLQKSKLRLIATLDINIRTIQPEIFA